VRGALEVLPFESTLGRLARGELDVCGGKQFRSLDECGDVDGLVGVFAAYSWWRSVKRPAEGFPGWMRAGVVIGSLLAVSTAARTAYLGGKIIHESPVLQLKDAPAGLPPAVAAELKDSTAP
jgi:hypothetical protein